MTADPPIAIEAKHQIFRPEIRAAREAVEILKQRPIEVVISDYRMPIMNGGVFVRAARETGYKGLFIIYSGRGKDPLIDQARRDGADAYIPRSGDFKKELASIKSIIYNQAMDTSGI